MMRRFVGWLCGVVTVAALAAQDVPIVPEAERLSPGPLLAFVEGDALKLAELEGERVFELGSGPRLAGFFTILGAGLLERLDRDTLLVLVPFTDRLERQRPTAREKLVLATGAVRDVHVSGHDVLFLDGKHGSLMRVDWRNPAAPAKVVEEVFEHIGMVCGNTLFAIGPGGDSVWQVSLVDAIARRVWTRPATSARDAVRIALAPGGRRLAIGSVGSLDPERGRIDVVDVATGDIVRSWSDLPLQLSRLSSCVPRQEVGFADDDHVICSESRADPEGQRGSFVFVNRDLRSGEVTDERAYAELGVFHERPVPLGPDRAKVPPAVFEVRTSGDAQELLRVATGEVLASVRKNAGAQFEHWVDLGFDGRFAGVRGGTNGNELLLFSAPVVKPRRLAKHGYSDLLWVPAAR